MQKQEMCTKKKKKLYFDVENIGLMLELKLLFTSSKHISNKKKSRSIQLVKWRSLI